MPIEKALRVFYNSRVWRETRARILKRAGDRCECRGECGRVHRRRRCAERRGVAGVGDGVVAGGRSGVGVAHLKGNSGELVPDHELAPFCAGCHLRYDEEQHLRARPKNRARKLEARGQGRLL